MKDYTTFWNKWKFVKLDKKILQGWYQSVVFRNNSRANTIPCGTPERTEEGLLLTSSITTVKLYADDILIP